MLGEPVAGELDLLPFEKFFRAYIGFVWFHAAAAGETAADVCSRLQRGVNRTVEATPVLSGTLKEEEDEAARGRAYVAYNSASNVQVELIHVGFSYAQISKSGFDQNMYRELFMDQQMLLSAMPGINDEPVLRVQLFWLQGGSWAVGILCHHVLADAYATFRVAQSIGRAARGMDPLCLDASRAVVADAMLVHERQAIPSSTHVREMFAKQQTQLQKVCKDNVLDGQMRRRQIRITRDAIGRLKQGTASGTANTLVMALLWRTWTRMLVQRADSCSSPLSKYTYIGWPIDMRRHLHASKAAASRYLGNLFLPYMGHATKRFVLDQPLAQVAMLLAQMTQSASLGQLRAFSDSVSAGEPDVRGLLEASDSPVLSFSNMTKLALLREDEDVVDSGAGLPLVRQMQMLAIDAPMMMFAIDDGAGGMLINVVMPSRVADAFAADAEFAKYADLAY
ncbi:hypothetical protein GGI22_001096 [Coemansia erecta]|nr:hypothetical protein GGI22_001096 [Coemansia erecta]